MADMIPLNLPNWNVVDWNTLKDNDLFHVLNSKGQLLELMRCRKISEALVEFTVILPRSSKPKVYSVNPLGLA